ncbi:RICIN domain-containing protein [Fortiea contorta]|uniref:RICIN domain-containing protein n=1 Tax=Fortiea contorta TaxID=1892405 RepID=UPI0003454906|nr:RICIN domain-containing protein [Fortiea contorta]
MAIDKKINQLHKLINTTKPIRNLCLGLLTSLTFLPIVAHASNEGYRYIRVRHSDKCLHVNGNQGIGNGVAATQWQCVDQNNLKWKLEAAPGGNDYYFIRSKFSDKCLQIDGASMDNGAAVTQWDCVNQNNVKWKFVSAGEGYFYIKAKHSDKCLQVDGGSLENGARISQWDCVNQSNVKWKVGQIVN